MVISPCDVYATAEAIHEALEMPVEERAERRQMLSDLVEREDITRWLCSQLDTVTELNL